MSVWVTAVLAFAAVGFGIIAIALFVEGLRTLLRRRALRNRLDTAIEDLQQRALVDRQLVEEAVIRARNTDNVVARLPALAGAAGLLRRARLDWNPLSFALVILGFAMAGGMFALAARLAPALAGLVALIMGSLPYFYVRRKSNVVRNRFESQLPEAIDYLARAVRAGHPLSAGVQMAGEELAEPLGGEFRLMFDQQRFGVPFEEALLGLCDRVDLVDVRIFATSIIVQREVGGASFAEVLDNMADTIRTRFMIRRELNVYTAQGRLSGMIVAVMPIVCALAIYAMDPAYIKVLFEHPIGRLMTVIGVSLQIMGFFWIRHIVNVEI